MVTLTLNDGTVLLDSNVYQDENRLYVYINNGDGMKEVFDLLIDPEKTQRIERKATGIDDIFEGFTKLINVTDEGNGMITAVLKKTI